MLLAVTPIMGLPAKVTVWPGVTGFGVAVNVAACPNPNEDRPNTVVSKNTPTTSRSSRISFLLIPEFRSKVSINRCRRLPDRSDGCAEPLTQLHGQAVPAQRTNPPQAQMGVRCFSNSLPRDCLFLTAGNSASSRNTDDRLLFIASPVNPVKRFRKALY